MCERAYETASGRTASVRLQMSLRRGETLLVEDVDGNTTLLLGEAVAAAAVGVVG